MSGRQVRCAAEAGEAGGAGGAGEARAPREARVRRSIAEASSSPGRGSLVTVRRLQLRGDAVGGPGGGAADLEGGCAGGACQFSVVSLMIDKLHSHLCVVLLSTGHINVIDLYSGATLFQR